MGLFRRQKVINNIIMVENYFMEKSVIGRATQIIERCTICRVQVEFFRFVQKRVDSSSVLRK